MAKRLGLLPRIPGRPSLKLSSFLRAAPDHPLAVDYGARIPQWGMRLNDRKGTCMAATMANSRLLTTTWLTDTPVNWTDPQVLDFYATQNPNGADDGMVMQIALEDASKGKGLPVNDSVQPVAFAEVDLGNEQEIDAAISIFGGLMLGITVTSAQYDQFDLGQAWAPVPRSRVEGGHAVEAVGYGDGVRFITWAAETELTDAFREQLADEAWVVVWPELLGTRQFQQGIDLGALRSAFKDLTGRDLPIPTPAPPPDPEEDPDLPFRPTVAARLVRNAARHQMTPMQYADWRLAGDFDLR